MPYNGLNEFIKQLEENNELIRIKEYVNPDLEITEITDRISKAEGPALLFENNGTQFPLLINAYGSEKRMCLALGTERLDNIPEEIENLFKEVSAPKTSFLDKIKMLPKLKNVASWMPKTRKGKGKCQEVILRNPDIFQLPVLQCWPYDGGKFLTLPVIHTKDPETGIRNVGMYRVQLFEPNLCAIHWQLHKVSRKHFEKYKKLGKKMPVAITLGGDPVYAYAATAPLPENVDEYLLAGFIRKKGVRMVKCVTQDIEVPEDCDIVIEGYVDPSEEFALEGPFGDHTGFYSLPDFYPKFHITAITHRKDAVFPATIVGIPPQEDKFLGKATERIFLAPIKMSMVPEILDMHLPAEGVFHNCALVKIRKEFPAQAFKVMNALWGAGQMMFTKIMIVVDEQAPHLEEYQKLAQYISENWQPEQDTLFLAGPMDVLDHSAPVMAFGGKIGLDATRKLSEEKQMYSASRAYKLREDILRKIQENPLIINMNAKLVSKGISVVILEVEDLPYASLRELARQTARLGAKIVVFLDKGSDIFNYADVFWLFTNNTDVKKDLLCFENGTLVFDGTRKNKQEGFLRDWPNPVVMNEETIRKIDAMWDKLGLGEFLPSPSLKYRKLEKGKGAIAHLS